MPIRDDDDLDVVAGLSATRDDEPVRRSAQPGTDRLQVKPARETETHQNHQPVSQAVPVVRKSGRGFAWFAGFVMLGLVVACGWLGQQLLQVQQLLAENNNALQLERSRMESISAQVHETGSSFAETGNVLEQKFSFFDSEIRKLWDVSNKRNKSAIASNEANMKSLKDALKASQQAVQGVKAGQMELTQSLEQINKRLISENTALRAIVDEQAEQVLQMRSEMALLQKRFTNLPNDLAARVTRNEEAVEAIDAGRRQLVARITQLQKQLDALQATP